MAFYATEAVPRVILPLLSHTGYYMAASDQTLVFPFILPPLGLITVNVIQQIGTQDGTLRAWVSAEPNGISVTNIQNLEFWHPSHLPTTIVTIYDINALRPLTTRPPLPLPPNGYFLNVQNLENRNNVFYALLTLF